MIVNRDSYWAAYAQKACNCRRGIMCDFCGKWLTPEANNERRARRALRKRYAA